MHLKKVRINFHGGEPTLQKPVAFDEMCTIFRRALDPLTDLALTIQTNGTLITDEWIELFSKHHVGVGVSCDGPPEWHDRVRVDHRGRGSHEKMKSGMQKLVQALEQNRLLNVGILCVINLAIKPEQIYRHFTQELGVKQLDFLLPDAHHDNFNQNAAEYGSYLSDLFDVWMAEDNPDIQIRILEKAIVQLSLSRRGLNKLDEITKGYREITIASNGSLGTVDVLRLTSSKLFTNGDRVDTTSLEEYLHTPLIKNLTASLAVLPDDCRGCRWRDSCQGGYMTHRYSSGKLFNNRSIYCEGLKILFSRIEQVLAQSTQRSPVPEDSQRREAIL